MVQQFAFLTKHTKKSTTSVSDQLSKNEYIPKPVWAVGFALEQSLHVVALTVFSYVDFKVASA
ncbi:MAG: hypothetical protein LBH59_05220 [Planctomycetaceae bacterium]|nr:hypothetical protein [Planctomycetaceae bacterium]